MGEGGVGEGGIGERGRGRGVLITLRKSSRGRGSVDSVEAGRSIQVLIGHGFEVEIGYGLEVGISGVVGMCLGIGELLAGNGIGESVGA